MADVEHAKGMLSVYGIEFTKTNGGFCVRKGNDIMDYSSTSMTDEEFCAYVKGIGDARTLFGITD